MKRLAVFILLSCSIIGLRAQSCYWVFLTDKQGSTFDPYCYFDAKAVERYMQNGADLYDISNYPLSSSYVQQVDAIASEEIGQSRWLNAIGVVATVEQVEAIKRLSCVKEVLMIGGDMQLAQYSATPRHEEVPPMLPTTIEHTSQIERMQSEKFRNKGYDGTGIRIAVLDGGFPRVNTHEAFKHLREGKKILDTWNFPNHTSNVYGWNSHGLSTLSCITGVISGHQLGLATGAEFLLYRTEVKMEPFREEVWWMQGMERADKQGANIISSSLGYGKDRYYTKDMDGTSYVAKAANMAARKGILVCCSAGNEGDDDKWYTIVTPSDADSVLCVGGIEASLTQYKHIKFSSYGPTEDGRRKPNVAAFGNVAAAVEASNEAVNSVYGTSFSCPLVAGFAACAWQANPGKTAIEMLQLIEQSADLYPYFDYAVGHGVPQASYFTDKPKTIEPTFTIEETDTTVVVRPAKSFNRSTIFFNAQKKNGQLERYYTLNLQCMDSTVKFVFEKPSLCFRTLNVCYEGYNNSYTMPEEESHRMQQLYGVQPFDYYAIGDTTNTDWGGEETMNRKPEDSKIFNENPTTLAFFVSFGNLFKVGEVEPSLKAYSPAFRLGVKKIASQNKWYSVGYGLEYGHRTYNYATADTTLADKCLELSFGNAGVEAKKCVFNEIDLEVFQRVRLIPGGRTGKGLYWDLGLNVSFANTLYRVKYNYYPHTEDGPLQSAACFNYSNPSCYSDYRVKGGVVTRLCFDKFGIYGRYTLDKQMIDKLLHGTDAEAQPKPNILPRLELGVILTL